MNNLSKVNTFFVEVYILFKNKIGFGKGSVFFENKQIKFIEGTKFTIKKIWFLFYFFLYFITKSNVVSASIVFPTCVNNINN